jgi:uncharacterized membrane protein
MADRRLRVIALVLAVAGIGITTYLTYTHYAGIEPACSVVNGCEKVLTSKYSKLLGVPLSLFGLIGYVAIAIGLWIDGERGRTLAAFFALIGMLQSLYLLYREIFTLDAFCMWCLGSLVVMALLLPIVIWRLLRDPSLAEAG